MKKVLFATTALVATAGVAAADVTFGGFGRFGLDYNDGRTDQETRYESRVRVVVTATAEADNGLSFGTEIRYQANEDANSYRSTGGFNAPRFWVSTGGLEVSVGNVQGALEWMPGLYDGGVGLTGLGFAENVAAPSALEHDYYSSGTFDRTGIDIKYSAGDFGFHLSHSSEAGDFFDNQNTFNAGEERTAAQVSYSTGGYTFAVAVQEVSGGSVEVAGGEVVSGSDFNAEWAATASGTFGPATVTLKVAEVQSTTGFGVGVSFAAGASTTISGFANFYDNDVVNPFADDIDGSATDTAYGIGFNHDMGGGTSLRGGVAEVFNDTRADLGFQFSF